MIKKEVDFQVFFIIFDNVCTSMHWLVEIHNTGCVIPVKSWWRDRQKLIIKEMMVVGFDPKGGVINDHGMFIIRALCIF